MVNHVLGKNPCLSQTELVTLESVFVPFSSMKPACLASHFFFFLSIVDL